MGRKYRWANAREWYESSSVSAEEFLGLLFSAGKISNDDIQDVLQDDMEKDGYFIGVLDDPKWPLNYGHETGDYHCKWCGRGWDDIYEDSYKGSVEALEQGEVTLDEIDCPEDTEEDTCDTCIIREWITSRKVVKE